MSGRTGRRIGREGREGDQVIQVNFDLRQRRSFIFWGTIPLRRRYCRAYACYGRAGELGRGNHSRWPGDEKRPERQCHQFEIWVLDTPIAFTLAPQYGQRKARRPRVMKLDMNASAVLVWLPAGEFPAIDSLDLEKSNHHPVQILNHAGPCTTLSSVRTKLTDKCIASCRGSRREKYC